MIGSATLQETEPCTFNTMCSCRYDNKSRLLPYIRDVSCVGIPFSKLPDLPHGHIAHLDVVGAGLEAVDGDSVGANIESLRLINNNIVTLAEKTFMTMTSVLRSLDLSYNELEQIPIAALCSLKALNWLNLHRNHITSISDGVTHWCHLKETITNLFLGENDISNLPQEGEQSLAEIYSLEWLSLDDNKLTEISPASLPDSLETLSVQNNYIKSFPTDIINQMARIQRIYLRGNFVTKFPEYVYKKKKKLDKLDVGDNYIDMIPTDAFSSTLSIRDLNLDCNKITNLSDSTFKGVKAGRIYLSMNKIVNISDGALEGLENTLEYLDVERNFLETVPLAISRMKKLKFLYLASNKISVIQEGAFQGFSHHLKALSLSGNQLEEIPFVALKSCEIISHLNIGYNLITEIKTDDFLDWASHLDTLLLQNNRIVHLSANTFKHTPNLRELSLSFNKLVDVDPDAFVDVYSSLESLEISFGMYREDFPDEFLTPLKSLIWLALDNNNLRTISKQSISNFSNLKYLNLEANRLTYLPVNLFNESVHTNLRDIRLSFNHLNNLETNTFNSLPQLQTVVLTGNNIRIVETGSFRDLPNLLTIVLSENRMNTIENGAFTLLPNLIKLELQNNELKDLSLDAFLKVTTIYAMSLNVSNNEISNLLHSERTTPISVKCLDLNHNKIQEVPTGFLKFISNSLRNLFLSYNMINEITPSAFTSLSLLEILTLEHNSILTLRRKAFNGLVNLQVIDLSHNHIEQLQIGQFGNLRNLRVIDLSYNHIRSLPRDVFQNTKLERLDISNNEFVVLPSVSFGEVGFTLRCVDISHNYIEHLDSTMFQETQFLTNLNLCNNKLTSLPDNVFSSLSNLLKLHICNNLIRANFKELFHYVQKLRTLNLGSTGLRVAPIIPIPSLVKLNLSDNHLQDLPVTAIEGLSHLRVLLLRGNRLTSVPAHSWPRLPVLKHLDISLNPIKMITKESFMGLERLETLLVTEVYRLERFDAGSLNSLRVLTTLSLPS